MSRRRTYQAGSEFPPLAPGKLRLYSMEWCPFAHRSRLVLEHKNVKHETVNIHLKNKPEWYTEQVNPLGRVPCIQLDDMIVYESAAVSEYVDEVYPGDTLTPSDPYRRAQDKMLIERHSKLPSAFYKIFFTNQVDEEKKDNLYAAMDILEEELKGRGSKFYGGATPMMVDYVLWPYMERVDVIIDIFSDLEWSKQRHGLVHGWVTRMKQVPAVQKTAYPHKKHMPAIMKAIADKSPLLKDIYDIDVQE